LTGGDLIRFVELSLHLSFQQTLAHLRQQLAPASTAELLERTIAFYQLTLHRHPEAVEYLTGRAVAMANVSSNSGSRMSVA
jgi:hypothetical protein